MGVRLRRGACALVIIDIQERYLPALGDAEALVDTVSRLAQGCELLGVPVIITEQNPAGIGHTAEAILDHTFDATVVEKRTFSCFGEPAFVEALAETKASQLIISGAETHVCVAQTALDASERGMDVFVVSDAVASRTAERKEAGIVRLRQAGCVQDCAEGILFSLLERADGDEFRMIHKIVTG